MHPIQEKLLQLSKIRNLSELSIREIGRQIGEDQDRVHPQLVKYHLKKLADASLLSVGRPAQAYKVIDSSAPKLIAIPIVGDANCGPATIFADERVRGYVKISPTLLKTKNYQSLFALQASGNSMNRAKIAGKSIDSGDYVIVDHSQITPRNGEYVVAIDDNKANIKKIFLDHENEQIALMSESTQDYAPIFIDPQERWDSLISGTVIQIVKNPSAVA